MTQSRWGAQTRQDNLDSGRDRILAAAKICYEKQGIAGTTLEDIAKEALISRRTVYRYFDNKQSIIQAVVDEQAFDFLQQMKADLLQYRDDFLPLLSHCIIYLVKHGPEAQGHQLLLGKSNAAITGNYYFSSKAIFDCLAELTLKPFEIAQQRGDIRADVQFTSLMRWVGRMVFSFIQFPTTDELLREQIDQFILTAIR
jgi:AcrR family transcriptional regulator